ncbi:hypothetical protein KEM55_006677 [Ascosphaera atra]|nr:hypothetical protein KEM55_006677 [Ascosphaera atra]
MDMGDDSGNRQEEGGEAEENTMPTLSARRKPEIRRLQTSSLRDRLKEFLPAFKAANEELEGKEGKEALRVELEDDDEEDEDEDEGEAKQRQYIEMNLGLGVLKEKQADDDSSSTSSEESDDDENIEPANDEQTQGQTDGQAASKQQQKNVMEKLMGKKSKNMKKPSIQEL